MVSLADWYILLILLQLGKLSGPQDGLSCDWRCPKVIHRVLQWMINWILQNHWVDLRSSGQWSNSMRLDRINILAFYITVYRQAAIFAESSRRFSATDQFTLNLSFLFTWSLLCDGQHRVDAVIPFLTQRWGFLSRRPGLHRVVPGISEVITD